jgi:hypothetical protein
MTMSTEEQTAERSRKLNDLYLVANQLRTQRLRFRGNPRHLASLRRRENAAWRAYQRLMQTHQPRTAT